MEELGILATYRNWLDHGAYYGNCKAHSFDTFSELTISMGQLMVEQSSPLLEQAYATIVTPGYC
jgi:hypothetical protein